MQCVLVSVCVFTPEMEYPVSKLSGALWWRGGKGKESLQLYVSGRKRRRRYVTLPWYTFTNKKKIAYNYSDPGGTLEKLNNLKPLFSCNEELYISKEVKEKMLLHQRANHADQKQWRTKINMRVITSQFEISSKNHIWSVKTFSPRA